MKLNELITSFYIHTSNEEQELLDRISKPCYLEVFTDREKFVVENLIRKSLVSKVNYKGSVVIIPNEKP